MVIQANQATANYPSPHSHTPSRKQRPDGDLPQEHQRGWRGVRKIKHSLCHKGGTSREVGSGWLYVFVWERFCFTPTTEPQMGLCGGHSKGRKYTKGTYIKSSSMRGGYCYYTTNLLSLSIHMCDSSWTVLWVDFSLQIHKYQGMDPREQGQHFYYCPYALFPPPR